MLLKVSAKSLKFAVTESFFYKVTASKPANNNKLHQRNFSGIKLKVTYLTSCENFFFSGYLLMAASEHYR